MTRREFIKRFNIVYQWLLRNNKKLLDKKFPKKLTFDHLKKLKIRYKQGLTKPSQCIKEEKNLYTFISVQLRKDKNWLKTFFPRWTLTNPRLERSFRLMMKLIPKDLVSLKEGQQWKGIACKHIFICYKYGEFKAIPNNLIRQSWKKGFSGHPKNSHPNKLIKIKETNQIFISIKECAKNLKTNRSYVSECLKRNKKCKDYTLEYVEENEKKEV